MKIKDSIQKISFITRSSDWRLSFFPFIIGCVYLWLSVFKIGFNLQTLILFFISLVTTVGFASLGYFINEYFDKESDRASGKINKLSLLTTPKQLLLFILLSAITFVPWFWLPTNKISWLLISCEIALFLLYSLPFPRFKTNYVVSGFIDSLYAYVIPLLLAYYTYKIYSGGSLEPFIYALGFATFFIGFRNITIHHVNDIFKDRLSGNNTLPQKIGVKKTSILITVLLFYEAIFFVLFSYLSICNNWLFVFWILFYLMFIFIKLYQLNFNIRINYVAVEPIRHLTDKAYQIAFPFFNLIILIIWDWGWLILLPIHILILTPVSVLKPILFFVKWLQVKLRLIFFVYIKNTLRKCLSMSINYPIYYLFLIAGVNLKKENMSAIEYFKKKTKN